MKLAFINISIFIVLFSQICISQSNYWKATNGPTGANIMSLTLDNNGNVFAGTYGDGVYKSTNNGTNWIESNTGLQFKEIFSICATNLGSVFAGTYDSGTVYQSTDGGVSWFPSLTLSAIDGIRGLVANVEGTIFVGTTNFSNPQGMFRSADNGKNWTQIVKGLSIKNVNSLTIGRNGYLYVGTHAQLFRSTDNGDNWAKLTNGLPESTTYRALGIDSAGGVLAATSVGIYRSTNDGQNWFLFNSTLPSDNVKAIIVTPSGTLFVSTYFKGLFRSTDNGVTWSATNTGLTDHEIWGITTSSAGMLLLGTRSGAYRSTDTGNTWQHVNNGLKQINVNSLLRHSSGTLIAGCDRGVFWSTDNGESWFQSSNLLTSTILSQTESPTGDVFFGNSEGYVYRSTNKGQDWVQANSVWGATGIYALASNTAGHIFATNTGVFRTTNNGSNWTYSFLPGYAFPYSIAIDSAGVIYTGTYNKGVFKSTDNGDTWIACGGNFTGTTISSLVIDNKGGILAGANDKVFYSFDQGTTWVSRSPLLSAYSINSIALNSNNHIFVATSDSGVYRSKNYGKTWSKINTGLKSVSSFSLNIEPNGFIQVGTGNSVFRSLQSTTLFAFQRDSVQFDTVKFGQSIADSILVTNNGKEILNISSISSTNPDFSITPQSASLTVGQGKWFRITFTPKYFGTIRSTIQFISNANTSPDELFVSGIGKAPYLNFETKNYNVGKVLLGDSKDSITTFSNIGNDTLKINNIVIADGHFSSHPTNFQILPGLSFSDTIRFTPTILGEILTKAIITSNSPSSPDTIFLTGIGNGIAHLHLSISQLTIDQGLIGSFKDTIITVSNTGNDTLKIHEIRSSNSKFNVYSNNSFLPPGHERHDTLRFTSETIGTFSALIIYQSNSITGADTIEISVISDVNDGTTPQSYSINQNYPNPFNPKTIISYSIPKQSNVAITIYDALGREVASLVNEEKEAGSYEVEFGSAVGIQQLASGIYFYQIRAGEFVQTKKMLLLR